MDDHALSAPTKTVERESKKESLESEVNHILRESRMVLPGIQALFGFQLIAVFSPGFSQLLPFQGRVMHIAATVLIACAIALIMAPAAYHRQAEPDRLTRRFAHYASTTVSAAMIPLLLALALEVALITFAVVASLTVALITGAVLMLLYVGLWFVYPRLGSR